MHVQCIEFHLYVVLFIYLLIYLFIHVFTDDFQKALQNKYYTSINALAGNGKFKID